MDDCASTYWDRIVEAACASPQPLWRRHSDAVNSAFVDRCLPPGRVGRVLKTDLFDEAMGDGLYPLLSARAAQVVGIDIAPAVVRRARERHEGIEGITSDVLRLPFAEGSFDAVVSNSTLDHFASADDIRAGLAEISRVLRPGGLLVITLDNPWNPVVALRSIIPLGLLTRLGVVPYFVGETCSRRALASMLASVGLTVARTTAVMHCPRAAAVFLARRLAGSTEHRADAFLRMLGRFERLGGAPTRFLTGYYIAVLARKPPADAGRTIGR